MQIRGFRDEDEEDEEPFIWVSGDDEPGHQLQCDCV